MKRISSSVQPEFTRIVKNGGRTALKTTDKENTMLAQIYDTAPFGLPATLAALENVRVTLPLLLLSVPTVLMLVGMASESSTANKEEDEEITFRKRAG